MTLWRDTRAFLALLLAMTLAWLPARGLVALNDGRDRIYVNASISMSHDSNVFASSQSEGDTVYGTSLSAEYTRRAGWIGVNANVGVSSAQFATIEGQDFANPAVGLEFTKQSGRTTGSITLNASRQSRADATVNTRVTSWNYNTGLGLRYPIVGTLTLSGDMGYSSTIYTDESLFSDLATYHTGFDLLHIFTSERDLIAGYRYRHGETSRSTAFSDHSFTTGVSGKIIRKVNGNLRAGYQFRVPHGVIGGGEEKFSSWMASGTATYAINKKININGQIAKDFSTTATDSFVDTLSAGLDGQYAYSSKWALMGGVSYGDSRFLGERGRIVLDLGPPIVLGPERRDSYLSWNTSINYSMNEHLKVSLSYTWFKNWSTSPFADFVRTGYNLTVSTRW